jgi:site-specific DNA recombinase
MLVKDEPFASIVKEALEGYATGRLQLQSELKRFLEPHPEYPRDKNGEVHPQRIVEVLTRPVSAGYVESRNGTSHFARDITNHLSVAQVATPTICA